MKNSQIKIHFLFFCLAIATVGASAGEHECNTDKYFSLRNLADIDYLSKVAPQYYKGLERTCQQQARMASLEPRDSCKGIDISDIKKNLVDLRSIRNSSSYPLVSMQSMDQDTNYVVDRFGLVGEDYCHTKNPRKAENIFEMGYDVPASFVDFYSSRYYERVWSREDYGVRIKALAEEQYSLVREYQTTASYCLRNLDTAKLKQFSYYTGESKDLNFARRCINRGNDIREQGLMWDVEAWYQINLEAARIWENLNCEAKADEARNFLVTGESHCFPGARQAMESLKLRILDFGVSSFLSFGDVSTDDAKYKEFLGKTFTERKHNRFEISHSMHPLVEQLLLFGVLDQVSISKTQEGALNIQVKDEYALLAFLKTLDLKPNETCSSYGLWPSANEVAWTHTLPALYQYYLKLSGKSVSLGGGYVRTKVACHTRFLPWVYDQSSYEVLRKLQQMSQGLEDIYRNP